MWNVYLRARAVRHQSSGGLVYYRATYSGENMAPSWLTSRMMQVTGAAFQAEASLNTQATDPKSHTPVRTFYTRFSPVLLPAKFRW